jgi:hypothetical protein
MRDALAAAILREMLALREEFRAFAERDRERARFRALSSEDRRLLFALVPAIAGACGGEPFAACDLAELPGPRVVIGQRSTKSNAGRQSPAHGQPERVTTLLPLTPNQ